MIPIRDDNPTIHTSFATFLIIAVNVAAWFFVQGFGLNPELAKSVCQFGVVPGELLGVIEPGTRIALGRGLACVVSHDSNWLTVITSMFMHGGWLHLIGNMWFLAIFGDNVEDAMGPLRFIVFYLLCGIGAVALQIISAPHSAAPMVGASGAIGGVMGAYAVLYPRAPVHILVFFGFFFTRIVVPAFLMLGYWFMLQFFGGFVTIGTGSSSGVAFWAHIGGFLTGIVLIKILCNPDKVKRCREQRGRTGRMVQRYTR